MSSHITPPNPHEDRDEQTRPDSPPQHERLIAADILFPQLGPDTVAALTLLLPTDRMSQDEVHSVMEACVKRYQSMNHEMNPNSSEPENPYVEGDLQAVLEHCNIAPDYAREIAQSLEQEIMERIMDNQARLAEQYMRESMPNAPYERLKQRELYNALSTTPREDAAQLSDSLGLTPSVALRFEKAYNALVLERHKMHVATAALMPIAHFVRPEISSTYSDRLADAHEKGNAILDSMVTMLDMSDSPVLPVGEGREDAIRTLLTRHLFSSKGPIDDHFTGTVQLKESSDYRFITSARNQMHNPALRDRFDGQVRQLQHIADEALNPDKTASFGGPLMIKHEKELEKILAEAEVSDNKAVAARIVNIFTKQVDLVQSRSNSGKT